MPLPAACLQTHLAQFWQEQQVIIVITSQLVTPLVDFLVMQVWEGAGDVSHARM
jgi:hypothetical protein